MMVMMIAMTPSLKASNRSVLITARIRIPFVRDNSLGL
jgi:hypothetical protein